MSVCYGEKRRYELPSIWVPKINDCFILGKRRNMSPNDAEHQSSRPCYRTRRHRSLRPCYRTRQTKTMFVCFYIGAPRANQDFICLLWGEAEVRVDPIWVPKINACFILGKRRNMSPNDAGHQSLRLCYRTRRHRSLRPYCRTQNTA